jgi:uncharacterized protein (AIM24 family)
MPAYSLVNEKMLQVEIAGEEVFAKKGAMIAYNGQIEFAPSFIGNEGVQSAAMRSVTGETLQLMRATGRGQVLYARRGLHITIISLRGETLFIESDSVLAFDSRLRSGTVFQGNQGVQGLVRGAATGQGLFSTTFDGQGDVAITSDGDTIGLDVTPEKPIFVDPNAYIGHKGNLSSQFVTDVNWKNLVGQGSGESFQLKFSGQGVVYIQASES